MTPRELLPLLKGLRAVVVGDVMLDEYVHGRATRISPEAPVMVLRQTGVGAVAGGAANVARNLTALGAGATVVGVRGDDASGARLEEALKGTEALLLVDPSRPTTRKTRVMAGGQQVVRLDEESTEPLSEERSEALLALVRESLAGADLVLFSDYQKGTLSDVLCQAVIREFAGPVFANGKPGAVGRYWGAEMVSLNRPETEDELGRPIDDPVLDATELARRHGTRHFLVTLSEEGMATDLFRVPAVPVEVADVAGAGDTTLAAAALGVTAVGFSEAPFRLAAACAAAVVRHHGVAVPTPADLASL